jgi:hypothetical protein
VKKRAPRTVLEYAISKAGILKGARVVAFVVQWTLVSQSLGRQITLAEYADWWNEKERTAYDHQREFREVFAMATPQPFADQAIVRAAALGHGVKGVGMLELDVLGMTPALA